MSYSRHRDGQGSGRVADSAQVTRDDGQAVVVRETGATVEITGSGEWDLVERQAFQDAMGYVLERCPECVVLDLSGLSFMDTSGLHNVLELRAGCEQRNIHLVIIPGRRAVQRVFEICGLGDSLPFLGLKP